MNQIKNHNNYQLMSRFILGTLLIPPAISFGVGLYNGLSNYNPAQDILTGMVVGGIAGTIIGINPWNLRFKEITSTAIIISTSESLTTTLAGITGRGIGEVIQYFH